MREKPRYEDHDEWSDEQYRRYQRRTVNLPAMGEKSLEVLRNAINAYAKEKGLTISYPEVEADKKKGSKPGQGS